MLLRQLLYRCEIKFLPIIAEHWLCLKSSPNYEELIRMLCDRMLDPAVLKKLLEVQGDLSLPLNTLVKNKGQIEAGKFESSFGIFRIAGIDKILREKMWKTPVSITEKLWYRGLIFRESRAVDSELKDCYILPEDLLEILKTILPDETINGPKQITLPVRPAVPSETVFVRPADRFLPDIFTLALALKRNGEDFLFPGMDFSEKYINFLSMLINEGGFFSESDQNEVSPVRNYLVNNRTASVIRLLMLWRHSENYDELSECDELNVIKTPDYRSSVPREMIIRLLQDLPSDTWISCNGFITAVKSTYPKFLRGSFKENRGQILDIDGNDLSGIGSWFQLEGAYLRFILFGPLQWLGIIQAAFTDKTQTEPSAFRISKEAHFYLQESGLSAISQEILSKPNLEQAVPTISSDGVITSSSKVPRYFRYMTARYSVIEKVNGDTVIFRITPASLSKAENLGLTGKSFLSMLNRFSRDKVPPSLSRMLLSEQKNILPATIYSATVLTVPGEAVMEELLSNTRLEKWICQQINPTSLLIDPKGINEIRRYLMEKEIFVDVQV